MLRRSQLMAALRRMGHSYVCQVSTRSVCARFGRPRFSRCCMRRKRSISKRATKCGPGSTLDLASTTAHTSRLATRSAGTDPSPWPTHVGHRASRKKTRTSRASCSSSWIRSSCKPSSATARFSLGPIGRVRYPYATEAVEKRDSQAEWRGFQQPPARWQAQWTEVTESGASPPKKLFHRRGLPESACSQTACGIQSRRRWGASGKNRNADGGVK
jgi:hypothetical protein